eukprot:GHVH01017006.1.p1 GENE.GHVH01017006.1~~GHVH01017006.1.p1  ORF type:complete len:314 (+),score=25.47 GHVH01017006.1:319-1260(+)
MNSSHLLSSLTSHKRLRWLSWLITSRGPSGASDASTIHSIEMNECEMMNEDEILVTNDVTKTESEDNGAALKAVDWVIVIGPNYYFAAWMFLFQAVIATGFMIGVWLAPGWRFAHLCADSLEGGSTIKPTASLCRMSYHDIAPWLPMSVGTSLVPSVYTLFVKLSSVMCVLITLLTFLKVVTKDPGMRHPALMNCQPSSQNYEYPSDLPDSVQEQQAVLSARNRRIKLRKCDRGWTYDNLYYFCEVCKAWAHRQEEVEHCDECGVCIIGRDHHCPWSSKCIGEGNFKWFVAWVTVGFITIADFMFSIIALTES